MKLIARLWLIALQRRTQEAPALILVAGAIALALGYYAISPVPVAASADAQAYRTGLVLVALTAVMVIPLVFRPDNVLDSRRFALLPLTPRRFFAIKLLIGNPLRAILAIIALLCGALELVVMRIGIVTIILEGIQLIAATMLVVAGMQLLEDFARTRIAAILYIIAVFGVMILVEGVLLYPSFYHSMLAEWLHQHTGGPGATVFLGGGKGLLEEVVVTIAATGLALGAVWTGSRVAKREMKPRRSTPDGLPGDRGSTVWARLMLAGAATYGKELALISRVAVYQTGIFITAVVSLIAAYTRIPFLFAASFFSWMTLAYNIWGPDQPFGGVLRYALLPKAENSLLMRRHATMVAVVMTVAVVVSVVVTTVVGQPFSVVSAISAWAYGATLFLFISLAGDPISRRFPKLLGLRAVILRGGFVSPIGWGGLVLSLSLAGGIFALVILCINELVPHMAVEQTAYIALPITSLVYAIFYATVHYWYRRSGT